ncbi:MAG: hypothetical protein EPN41_15640 [Candidimonas sp.]|nr:MAG: hypothetical protein EPN41_15640 [Candidimonas sp.]
MKRAAPILLIGLCTFFLSETASARVDLGVYLGIPAPVYVAPPVVYEAPPPPPPIVYREPPEIYTPGVVVVGGEWARDRDWREHYWKHAWKRDHWKHHGEDDDDD